MLGSPLNHPPQTVHQTDTIARQTDTIAQQTETIAQLRREVTQWKDQSRNWQEHFLRVEQERCALSSRMDELVSERLQVRLNQHFVSHSFKARYSIDL